MILKTAVPVRRGCSEISAQGQHPPVSSGSLVGGSEQRFLSSKCKESFPLPVPDAKKRHRPMLIP